VKPNLDILLPFHRSDNFLEQAVLSIASSQRVNYNVILIDDRIDKSTDLSRFFKPLSKFLVVKTPGGVGYGQALKIGSAALEADATALFNSDDLVHPLRFTKQLRQLDECSINFTKLQRIGVDGQQKRSLSGEIVGEEYDPVLLLLGAYGANASWCMRKEWWAENSFFDSEECLDWRIAMNTFPKSSVSYIPENLYFYRKHPQQKTADFKVSHERMDMVYQEWLKLLDCIGLNHYSYESFCALGVPWITNYKIDFSDFVTAAKAISDHSTSINTSVGNTARHLLKRRFIFGIRNCQLVSEKVKLLNLGLTQIPEIVHNIFF